MSDCLVETGVGECEIGRGCCVDRVEFGERGGRLFGYLEAVCLVELADRAGKGRGGEEAYDGGCHEDLTKVLDNDQTRVV